MILRQLTLCPFAGFAHRVVTFQPGMNVILGENEAGKSTLVQAIKAALFEPTHLGKRDLEKFSHAYFPKGNADQAKILLEFVVGKTQYTLEKTWGVGNSSKLQSNEGELLNDDSSVQKKLNELLKLHRGSWEEVLFADQQKMSSTVENIHRNKDQIDRIPTLEVKSGGLEGDVLAQDLLEVLQAEMQEYRKLWDFNLRGPKDNKGIQSPWERGLGTIIKAYYEAEKIRAQFNELNDLEVALENVGAQYKINGLEIQDRKAVIDSMKLQQQNVILHQNLTTQKNLLEVQLVAMKTAMSEWPVKMASQPMLEKNINASKARILSIQSESANAQKRNEGALIMQRYNQLKNILASVEEIKARLTQNGNLDEADIKFIHKTQEELSQLQIELNAQKLVATIDASKEIKIQTSKGTDPEQWMQIGGGKTETLEASGQVSFEWDGVKISVKSAIKSIDEILHQMQEKESAIESILKKYNLQSLAEFEKIVQSNQADNDLIKELRVTFKGITEEAKKTYDQIKEEAEALLNLPMTRSLNEIQTAFEAESEQLSEANQSYNANKTEIEGWENTYKDLGSLYATFAQESAKHKEYLEKIAEIPALPEGFEDAADYLDQLKTLEDLQEVQMANNIQLGNDLTRIQTQLDNFDHDALSLESEWESLQLKFERKLTEFKALELAEKKLIEIIQQNPHNPFAEFESETAQMFAALTGNRYQEITREGEAPVSVKINNKDIPTDLLSGGTAASLGLAVRLAYAKRYLKDMEGFFVLDDPFTEMDEDRRLLATQTLSDFAKDKQTFLFTCHPVHAKSFLHAHQITLSRT